MFYQRYAALCRSLGESPSAVAGKNGISSTSVTRWKNGAVPKGQIVARLARYFGVSADYLLCRTDRPNIAFSTAQAARAFLDQMQSVIDRANQTLAEFSEEEQPE